MSTFKKISNEAVKLKMRNITFNEFFLRFNQTQINWVKLNTFINV